MIPNQENITIYNNLSNTKKLLHDLVLRPRRDLIKWAGITKQTPNIKVGYTGQHLASMISGVEGLRTGARGHDLRDGSEVKSCSRIDQLDKCNECKESVARIEKECANCGSTNIKRRNDSKWLITVRNQSELDFILEEIPRVIFILFDYPNFKEQDWDTLRLQVYEIWPKDSRHQNFSTLVSNYYRNIYIKHIEASPSKTPAPKNFWPYSFQFYMCNPVRTFHCIINNALSDPVINVTEYIEPLENRSMVDPIPMPFSVLNPEERKIVKKHLSNNQYKKLQTEGLGVDLRMSLNLRDTDHAAPQHISYRRGAQ